MAVSNAYGSVTSAPVTLTVLTPPSITSQPLVGTAVAGANVTYIVTANGLAPLDYTWLFDGTAIFDSRNEFNIYRAGDRIKQRRHL